MRILFLFLLFLIPLTSVSQKQVNWVFTVEGDEFIATAEIAEGWHLYSQHINNEIGPIATSFQFDEVDGVKLLGKTIEPESIKEYDPNFEGELNFFKDQVTFKQKMKSDKSVTLSGSVTYMVCNDTMCLPPTDEFFTITIN